MPSSTVRRRCPASVRLLLLVVGMLTGGSAGAFAYGPQGFDTVVIDAGHGGYDRGGGPRQAIPEKPYTLDTALRLEQALRRRGFRTVMTRTDDTFVSLPTRVAIANSYRNAIFVSVHYNSAPRVDAHGYETYYYRGDSFGLASRLHRAQLATLDTEDRFVRRRGFYVVRRTQIPAVLCEGGFLTNPTESQIVLSASYRQRWAENIANAIAAQRREGDPASLGYQPPVTTERLVTYSHSRGGRSHATTHRGGTSRGRSRHGTSRTRSSHGSSSARSSAHHRRHHSS